MMKPSLLIRSTLLGWNTATTDLLYKEEASSGDEIRVLEEVGIASNAATAIDDAEWIMVAPYGEWQDGSPQRWHQVFTREQAEKMARSFNGLPGRLGRFFRGAGIYIGHPDCDPKTYPDHRRLGKVVELRAGEDGLYAKPVWNDLGRQNLEQGYYVYPSVTWRFPRPRPGERKVYPDLFQSVGLTNWPAGDVPAVTRNAVEPDQSTQEEELTMKKELLALLGLDENATAEQVQAAVAAALDLPEETTEETTEPTESTEETAEESATEETVDEEEDAAMNADLVAARDDLETARNALAEIRTREAAALIGDALEAGRITPADREGWEARFVEDHDAARNALAEIQGAHRLDTARVELGRPRAAIGDRAARMTAMNEEVQRRMDAEGISYDEAWNAAKRDPETAALFAHVATTEGE